jgi:hypothetical protein
VRTSRRCLKQLQNCAKSKNKMPVLTKRSGNSPKWLRWTSISCCLFAKNWWTLRRPPEKTMDQNRCLTTWEIRQDKTEKSVMKWLGASLTIRRNAFNVLKCFCKSLWQPSQNLRDLPQRSNVYRGKFMIWKASCNKTLLQMINLQFTNLRPMLSARKKNKNLKKSRSSK